MKQPYSEITGVLMNEAVDGDMEGYMKHAVDHYATGPGAPSLIGLKERFGDTMDVSIFENATKEEFLDGMNKAYPDFGWPFYLQGTANFLFETRK